MGVLSDLLKSAVQNEFQKKADERNAHITALQAILNPKFASTLKPEAREKVQALWWDETMKKVPTNVRGVAEMFKPVIFAASKAGAAAHIPGAKKLEDKTAPQPKTQDKAESPFLSPEQLQAQQDAQARKQARLDIAEAVGKEQATQLVKSQAEQANVLWKKQQIGDLFKQKQAGQLTDEEYQAQLGLLSSGKIEPPSPKVEGVLLNSKGEILDHVVLNKNDPTRAWTSQGQPFEVPKGYYALSNDAYKKQQGEVGGAKGEDEKRAFRAFNEKRGKPPDAALTATEQQQAIAANKHAEADPEVEAMRGLSRELAEGRLADQRKSRSEAPAEIKPGTREYKVAEDLAYGRLTFSQLRTLTAYGRDVNKKMDIYDKAAELNPAFNPADFERGYKFSSNPKVMQQIASLNNVKAGVDDLLAASDAAARSGSTLLNKAIIPGGIAIGNKKYSNFETARTAFADELSGALGYGSATDMSREMGFNMTNANLSPENFRAALQEIVIPFVERKKKSLTDQMSVYGEKEQQTGSRDVPNVTTQDEFDKLPSGTVYMEDGKKFKKP